MIINWKTGKYGQSRNFIAGIGLLGAFAFVEGAAAVVPCQPESRTVEVLAVERTAISLAPIRTGSLIEQRRTVGILTGARDAEHIPCD